MIKTLLITKIMSELAYNPASFMSKRRFTVLLACVINLCAGANYAWSIFAQSLANHLSIITGQPITSGTLAFAFSLACIFSPLSMIVRGHFADKHGPRYVLMFAGLSLMTGFLGAALSTTPLAVIAFYGIFVGSGMGSAFNTGMANVLKFFPDKGGMMGGIVATGFGASSVLIPPIAIFLLTFFDITGTLITIGVAFGATIFTCGLLTTRCPPNFKPIGWQPKVSESLSHDLNTYEMVHTKIFYAMFGIGFCGTLPGMMLISQAARIAQTQMQYSLTQAAMIVSIVAICNMSGRLIGGALSDRFGRIQVLMGMGMIGNLIGCCTLMICGPHLSAVFYVGICAMGLAFGCMNGIFPSFTTAVFGRKYNTLNYGIMIIALSIPGVLGPIIVNALFSETYHFDIAFAVGAVISLCGLGFGYLYRIFKINRN